MRIFVAGSTGAIGRFLVPLLVESGHEVVALVHNPDKVTVVEALGAKAAVLMLSTRWPSRLPSGEPSPM